MIILRNVTPMPNSIHQAYKSIPGSGEKLVEAIKEKRMAQQLSDNQWSPEKPIPAKPSSWNISKSMDQEF